MAHTSTTGRPAIGQIAHPDPTAAVADRPGAARLAAHHLGGRLHRQPPLAVDLEPGADHELGHGHQRGRALATVQHVKDLRLQQVREPQNREVLDRAGGPYERAVIPTPPHASSRRAQQRLVEFFDAWADRYPAVRTLWENAWAEFVPFLDYSAEIRRVIYSTNAHREPAARDATSDPEHEGDFPNEQAAMKCLYLVVRSLDPTGRGSDG